MVQAADPLGLGQSIDEAVSSFRRGLMVLANMALFFSAAFVGGLMVLIGLILIFRETSASGAGGKIASAARLVSPTRLVKS